MFYKLKFYVFSPFEQFEINVLFSLPRLHLSHIQICLVIYVSDDVHIFISYIAK